MYASYFAVTEHNATLCQAMHIAMGYVRGSGLAGKIKDPEDLVATTISEAWRSGVKRPIALADAAIVGAEKAAEFGTLPSLFPSLINPS
jgi:hypothetical protein